MVFKTKILVLLTWINSVFLFKDDEKDDEPASAKKRKLDSGEHTKRKKV